MDSLSPDPWVRLWDPRKSSSTRIRAQLTECSSLIEAQEISRSLKTFPTHTNRNSILLQTTLLDVLAQRKTEGTIQGEVHVDGRPLPLAFQRSAGYCEQLGKYPR